MLRKVIVIDTEEYLGEGGWFMPNKGQLRSTSQTETVSKALPGQEKDDILPEFSEWTTNTQASGTKDQTGAIRKTSTA